MTIDPNRVVLVEGESDQVALETAARLRGTDLIGERVVIISMDGIANLYRQVEDVKRIWPMAKLAGLYDEAESEIVASALQRSGFGPTTDLETFGFFACRPDLEYELIGAVGANVVTDLIEQIGDGPSFARMQNQPQWRDGRLVDQLHRFMGSQSGRKARYAKLFIEAGRPEQIPQPLGAMFEYIRIGS